MGCCIAIAVWEDADHATSSETLDDSFENAKRKTAPSGGAGSTVERFGDVTGTGPLPLSHFIGVDGATLRHGELRTTGSAAAAAAQAAPEDSSTVLESLAHKIARLAPALSSGWPLATPARVDERHFACYRRLNSNLDRRCASMMQGADRQPAPRLAKSPYSLMLRACEMGTEEAALAALAEACPTPVEV